MRAAKKTILDNKILQELVPLNALSPERFKEVAEKIVVEEVKSGRYLFRKGDRDNQSIYLLEGKVNLIDGFRKVASEVESGTDISRYPLSNMQPRSVSARAARKSVVARIDSSLLDAFLTWDQSNSAEAVEIGADENRDWMTRMLQSEAFMRIPPAMIQSLLMKMQAIEVQAGDVIISQGDEGDYFYTIHEGSCVVTRRDEETDEDQLLAELREGDSFGEESLVADTRRNASVSMLTDGVLMRLAKKDFVALLQEPLLRRVNYQTATAMVDEGAVWVDVRTPDEYESGSFEDSVNIPLATLRGEIPELVFNAKYVMCCDTGRRSGSAAFMLSHRGFDVYLLEGGMSALDATDESGPDTGSESAGAVEFEAALPELAAVEVNKEVHEAAATPADTDSVTGQGGDAAAADLEAVVGSLRAQNEALREDLDQYRSTEARLTEQLELLRAELGESGEKLATLYSRVREDSDEKRRLHEEYARLQESYTRRLKALQSEVGAARKRQQEEVEATQQSGQEETQQLQEQLAQAGSRIQALEDDLAAASAAGETLQAEHAALVQQQDERIAGLQQALDQAGQKHEQLSRQLAASSDERNDAESGLRTELQEQISLTGKLEEQLTALQQHSTLQAEHLTAATSSLEALEARNTELVSRVETLQRELDEDRQRLEQQAAAAESERQALEHRIEELSSNDRQDGERLSAVLEEYEAAGQKIRQLEQELEEQRAAQREADGQLQEQAARADNMAAGRQAAEQALEDLQASHAAEQSRYQEDAGALQQTIAELRAELDAAQQQADAGKAAFEEQLEQLRDEKGAQQEQYEARLLELQQEQSEHAAELQEARDERDNWQQQLNARTEEHSLLQQDIARLNEQVATLTASGDEQLQALHARLDTDQQQIAELEQTIADKDAQLAGLQQSLAEQQAGVSADGQQQELLRQQLEALQQELVEHDERARLIEQEHQEAIRKAHEDLTRKNDNEKELQCQIDRLRKQLEQATLQQQQLREDAQDDIDNIREELHAERQARAEERAEMAARQRELKEQLIAVASEHETSLNNQSGAIEEARGAAREEERIRLQGLLETRQQTEEQLHQLHAELQQAHAEIARLDQQEKDRRQAGSDLLQERNSQAEAAIAQLESQLKQLTEERDQLLEGQLELHEKMNLLRGETEVARGMMHAGEEGEEGEVEDPVRLRHELDESQNNLEIAMRLRAEAEAARDQLVQERDALRELVEGGQDGKRPLHVPALGEGDATAGLAGAQHADASRAAAGGPELETDEAATASPAAGKRRRHGWLGKSIGVVTVGMAALMFWLTLDIEEGSQHSGSGTDAAMDRAADADLQTDTATADSSAVGEQAQAVAQPAKPAAGADPGNVLQQSAEAEPDAAAAPKPTAGPEFRDKLRNGSKGPLMTGLPGGSYLMGSIGNSLNFDEGPQHRVTLPGFAISKHEVTFAEYDRFARATGRRLPRDERWGRGDRPVINVSWDDASAYTAWLSKQTGKTYRLPTEAEWEYAIRAGTEEQHWWADDSGSVPANCFDCGSRWDGNRTAPVGSFAANNFGLHDMAGNVQEWTEDCYRAGYADAPVDGSAWMMPQCTQRVVRGGAYTSPQDSLRSAKRGQYDQETRLDNLGFRVVREN